MKEGDWLFNGCVSITVLLTSSSYCFVALIVFLRLLAVKWPLDYQTSQHKISRVGSIIIWCFPLVVNIPLIILNLPGIYESNAVRITTTIIFHVTHSIPIFATVIIYTMLLYTLKQTRDISEASSSKKRSLAKMVRGVVICLVVLNVPYLVWGQHLSILWSEERQSEAFTTYSGVRILS